IVIGFAKGASLVEGGDGTSVPLLHSQVVASIVLRTVAQTFGDLVLPPAAIGARHTVNHRRSDIGVIEADLYELPQVAGTDPDGSGPLAGRISRSIADPDGKRADTRRVIIETGDQFAPTFRQSVTAVGAGRVERRDDL